MARFATITGFLLLAVFHVTMSITVQEFFVKQDVKSNLTKITWSHATNSQDALKKALNSSEVMMIEADVAIGILVPTNQNDTVIMTHPDSNSALPFKSDLSLDNFLKNVTANKTKGIKLDFKSIEAFEKGVKIVKSHAANLTAIPVWINADILVGPGKPTDTPVDKVRFLKGAAELPEALLSIGWTTSLEKSQTNATYTIEHINEMIKLLAEQKTNQSITYPVRAAYAANDVDGFKTLLANTTANKPTLTIWSSEGDVVNATKLSAVINRIGLDKVFVDVPKSLKDQLTLNSAFTAQSSVSLLLVSLFAALFKLL